MSSHPGIDETPSAARSSLLLVLPTLFHKRNGILEVEEQAANGLRLYRQHFDRVTVAAGTLPASAPLPPSLLGQPADEVAERLGLSLCPLPRFGGYREALRGEGPLGLRQRINQALGRLAEHIDDHRVDGMTQTWKQRKKPTVDRFATNRQSHVKMWPRVSTNHKVWPLWLIVTQCHHCR